MISPSNSIPCVTTHFGSQLCSNTPRNDIAFYPEILPSAEQVAELQLEIGDLVDPNNPARRLQSNVLLISGNRCVKCGGQVHEREAMAMEYVRRNTDIPVPRVHWFFKDGNMGFLVMDYTSEGGLLRDVQMRIPANQREHVVAQMNDYIQQLRFLGGIGLGSMGSWQPHNPGKPTAYNNAYYRWLEDLQPAAPFPSMEELREHWLMRWTKREELGNPPNISIDEVPRRVVLGHGDFGAHNLLVKDGAIIAVLDWDTFGWYPLFWDYGICRRGLGYASWKKALDKIFDPMTDAENVFSRFIMKAYIVDD